MTNETTGGQLTAMDKPPPPGQLAAADVPPASGQMEQIPPDGDVTHSMLNFVAGAAVNPDVSAEKLESLYRLQREIIRDQAAVQFNQAYIRLQSILPRITKNGSLDYPINKNDPDGPKRQISKFAKWEDIDRAIRPLMIAEGFSLRFNTEQRAGDGGGLLVTCFLMHRNGHVEPTSIPVPLDTSGGKNNLQAYGSALSYGKRYTATAALNLITEGEDDDGKRGGVVFLSDDQRGEIMQLLKETKTAEGQFLSVMCSECRSVEEVESRDFPRLKNALLTKRSRLKGTGNNDSS